MTQTTQSGLILIAGSDNSTDAEVLVQTLTEAGLAAKLTDGEKAIEQGSQEHPDVILLDMPEPGSTCQKLKNNPPTADIPVIAIAPQEDKENLLKALKLGAADYITKPWEPEELLARVRLHLQLRNSTKLLMGMDRMSSLGKMVGGVTHEMNNAVGLVYGNVDYANDYVKDMLSLIEVYQDEYPEPTEAVEEAIEEVDLEFLVEDLEKMLQSMKNGAERMRDIVMSLQNFSRMDEDSMKPTDIHESIDGILVILHNIIKKGTEVVKEYGKLPNVTCYPALLSQVFMNTINYSLDALAADATSKPTITIRTEMTDSEAIVRIADNGPGISASEVDRIFDPFSTSTGNSLGLFVARNVIEVKHGGKLSCTSTPGEGTEFVISLPLGN